MKLTEDTRSELIKRIESYIDGSDYYEAKNIGGRISENVQEEFMDIMLNELKIKNDSIISYARYNFDRLLNDVQKIIEERREKHEESKQYMLPRDETRDIGKNEFEEKIEECKTEIDYEQEFQDKTRDAIEDIIVHMSRIMDNANVSSSMIDQMCEMLKLSERMCLQKYGERFSEELIQLDNEMVNKIKQMAEEYFEKEKEDDKDEEFKNSIKVENEDCQIEKNAIENMENKIQNTPQKKRENELSDEGIF